MSADEIAKAFIPHYYNLFDTNREGLFSLFRNESQLTFEGDGPKTGAPAIMEKLRALPPVTYSVESFHGPRRHRRRRSDGAETFAHTGPAPGPNDRDAALDESERDPRLLHREHSCGAGEAPKVLGGVPARGIRAGPVLPAQRDVPIQLLVGSCTLTGRVQLRHAFVF